MYKIYFTFVAILVFLITVASSTHDSNTTTDVSPIDRVNSPLQEKIQMSLGIGSRPRRRPVKPRPSSGLIKPRPSHHQISIQPVLVPIPIFRVVLHLNRGNQSMEPIPTSGWCVKPNGDSIATFCQARAAREFHPTSQNSTWETCCSAYIELDCYLHQASAFCTKETRKSLADFSQIVANFFNSTICGGAVAFKNWSTSCKRDKHKEESEQFSKAIEQTAFTEEQFIELPPVVGSEKACIDKLRSHSQGNMDSQCLSAAIDVWDQDRSKLKDSLIYEPCCAMFDALDCLQTQANELCTKEEALDVTHYRKLAATAFSQGVCRAVPFDRATQICRGRGHQTVPSLLWLITVLLFAHLHSAL